MTNPPKDEIAYVSKIEGKNVWFSMAAGASCESCGMHGLCGGKSKHVEHVSKTDFMLKVGDKIRVTMDSKTRLLSSFLIFIFPLIMLIMGYLIASSVFKLTEGQSILSGFGALLVAFGLVAIIDRKFGKNIAFKIVEKLNENTSQ